MSTPQMDTGSHASKRVRVRRACVPCSKRKRKCNGLNPCDVYDGYGYECTYRKESDHVPQRSRQIHSEVQDPSQEILTQVRGDSWNHVAPLAIMSPDATEQVNESNNGLLVLSTSQYLGRHSAEAFPRFLALQLRIQPLPKLQPFGWNLKSRPKSSAGFGTSICALVSLDVVRRQVRSFFLADFPASAFLDMNTLLARCETHWQGNAQGLAFEALVAGIISLTAILGFFQDAKQEACLVEHAQRILSDDTVLGIPNIEVLAALVMRYLYLRATATPQVTWLTICTAMHLAESLGLHKQYNSLNEKDQPGSQGWDDEARSYLFWVISAGNHIGAHDLGRTPVLLHGVTRAFPFALSETSSIANLCRVAHLLPLKPLPQGEEQEIKDFSDALDQICAMRISQPLVKLIAADVCFTLYRRIRVSTNQRISIREIQKIIIIGREAVQAVRRLLGESKSWWNMISTLFQFCCVLLDIDSADSLPEVKSVMTTISMVIDSYPGYNVLEAVATLDVLMAAFRQRKQFDLQCLAPNATATGEHSYPAGSSEPEQFFNDVPWRIEDLDWIASDMLFHQDH